jgi:hypothetical protein
MQKENACSGLDLVRCNILSKMYQNRNKTPGKVVGLKHPPAELLVSDLPAVPTAHLTLTQICRYIYLNVQYRNIQTHTDNTIRYSVYIQIQIHTYRYRYICTALKQGWEVFFHAGSGRS